MSDEGIKSEQQYAEVHQQESKELLNICDNIIYRVPLDYEAIEFDLKIFFATEKSPIVLLDACFIPKEKGKIYSKIVTPIITSLYQSHPKVKQVILAGSSFPSDPTAYNNGKDYGENQIEECIMYEECRKIYPNLIYGDYATIHPLPNERAGGHGWIPRIDFPTESSIIYYRSRKDQTESNYTQAYKRAARKVVNDLRFVQLHEKLGENNWGIQQILLAARGYPPGLSPSFWISVRINLHVTLRHLLLTSKQ
jgi:hypothetical protein